MQTWSPAHAVAQFPQWVGSFVVSAQAVPPSTEHAVRPAPHPVTPRLHLPLMQKLPPRPLQGLVHVPQWLGSLWRSTQLPLQSDRCGPQAVTQAPFWQVLPPAQCVVQSLQNWGSVLGSTQAVPNVTEHFSDWVVLQVMPQLALVHVACPVWPPDTGGAQGVQDPQWSG